MPRAIWSGAISFGLVAVPVQMVTATKSKDVRFNQLDGETGSRIRYRKVSDATSEEVPDERIVKGYEVAPGQYVVVTPEELEAAASKSTRRIDIEEFVDLAEIDPVYFEQPYYLVPEATGTKPYRLLVDAMTELQKVAIGRVVLRTKERLVAIRPLDGVLCLETMRYADEVLDAHEHAPMDSEDVTPSAKELTMARQLIEALTADFEPQKYHDEYREQMLALIDKKAAGEELVAAPATEAPAKVLDLVAALEASLARTDAPSEPGEEAPAKKRRTG
jgi:DNA end-binding protein Ku